MVVAKVTYFKKYPIEALKSIVHAEEEDNEAQTDKEKK
jgi:hypothetical protein